MPREPRNMASARAPDTRRMVMSQPRRAIYPENRLIRTARRTKEQRILASQILTGSMNLEKIRSLMSLSCSGWNTGVSITIPRRATNISRGTAEEFWSRFAVPASRGTKANRITERKKGRRTLCFKSNFNMNLSLSFCIKYQNGAGHQEKRDDHKRQAICHKCVKVRQIIPGSEPGTGS